MQRPLDTRITSSNKSNIDWTGFEMVAKTTRLSSFATSFKTLTNSKVTAKSKSFNGLSKI